MGVPSQLPDTVGQSTLLAICIMMILVVYNESIFKAKPWLLGICSFIIAITLEVGFCYLNNSKVLQSFCKFYGTCIEDWKNGPFSQGFFIWNPMIWIRAEFQISKQKQELIFCYVCHTPFPPTSSSLGWIFKSLSWLALLPTKVSSLKNVIQSGYCICKRCVMMHSNFICKRSS